MTFPTINSTSSGGSVFTDVRSLMPRRRLNTTELRNVAERQALRLLSRLGVQHPDEIVEAIASLPRVQIRSTYDIASSGLSAWTGSHWQILLKADDAYVRRRFSLAHEIFHVLSHPYADVIFKAGSQPATDLKTELACDYFAGTLLMPRPWLKAAYVNGYQDLEDLARLFGVSRAAMKVRLDQTGIVADQTTYRCRRGQTDRLGSGWYQRAAARPLATL